MNWVALAGARKRVEKNMILVHLRTPHAQVIVLIDLLLSADTF